MKPEDIPRTHLPTDHPQWRVLAQEVHARPPEALETPSRAMEASALLSTRVDIAREQQTHLLLDSMNRRAKLRLRLQATVEILPVIPITYYLVSLCSYATRALKAAHFPIDPDLVEGVAVPSSPCSSYSPFARRTIESCKRKTTRVTRQPTIRGSHETHSNRRARRVFPSRRNGPSCQ